VCGLFIFLITFVVPQFAKLYDQIGTKLPAMTLAMLALGKGAQHYILYALPVVALIGYLAWRWSRSDAGAERIDSVRIRMPIFGKIWLKYQVAMFARTLSTLLTGGIPLVPSLETAARSIRAADQQGSVFFGHDGAGRQEPGKEPRRDEGVPGAFDGDDRGGRVDGRAAADAEFGGEFLRTTCRPR